MLTLTHSYHGPANIQWHRNSQRLHHLSPCGALAVVRACTHNGIPAVRLSIWYPNAGLRVGHYMVHLPGKAALTVASALQQAIATYQLNTP